MKFHLSLEGIHLARDIASAAKAKDFSLVADYVAAGADVNVDNHVGETALLWATIHSRRATIKLLLKAGADPNVGTRSKRAAGSWRGSVPLHFAMHNGDAKIIEMLLKAGADPRATNAAGGTALEAALYGKNPKVAHLLVSRGVNVNDWIKPCAVKRTWYKLLALAVRDADVSDIRLLLKLGASVISEKGVDYPPMRFALMRGNKKIIAIIREAGGTCQGPV